MTLCQPCRLHPVGERDEEGVVMVEGVTVWLDTALLLSFMFSSLRVLAMEA